MLQIGDITIESVIDGAINGPARMGFPDKTEEDWAPYDQYRDRHGNLPLFVPGWEDSTLGNIFAAHCIAGKVKTPTIVRSGIEYMIALADFYRTTSPNHSIGFFQVGGGIAGDFPICVVPMMTQDLQLDRRRFLWQGRLRHWRPRHESQQE